MYLQRRRRKWYALHDIPADVRQVLGRGARFVQSLGTEEHATAKLKGVALEMHWRSAIDQARRTARAEADGREKDATVGLASIDAERWRKLIREASSDEQRQILAEALDDELDAIVHRAAARAGIQDPKEPEFEGLPERIEGARIFAIATGALVPLSAHLEEYLGTLHGNEAKSVDMKRSTLRKFSERFPHVADVQRKDVQRWVNDMAAGGKALATIRRSLSELRGYWGYLTAINVVPETHLPFDKLALPKSPKGGARGRQERKPFEPADVIKLLEAAQAKGDHQLESLIRLGMWTGARIEELCSLRVEKVGEGYISIEDAKTPAGWRQVPIHSQLQEPLRCLLRESTDGYILMGLSRNKYGDRSNAVGKRFGRLKAELGFTEQHVFHSIRKTVATLLENVGVPEGVSADILGHDKPTMTYGLYSGGASLEVKRMAIEKLTYVKPLYGR
jgi:integrase